MMPPIGRCVFCIYEIRLDAARFKQQLASLPVATTTIDTPNGPRDVCSLHATRGAR